MTDFYDKEISKLENDTRNLEQLKSRLNNPYLIDFLNERINSPKEHEKKQELLRNFSTLSKEEQRIYRDYIANLMKNDPNMIKDFDDDLNQLIWLLRSMDRMEVYASIQNAYKNEVNNILEQKYQIEITWWKIEKKVIKPFSWFKVKNETYDIVWWYAEYIWNNIYKINLEWLKKEKDYLRYKTTDSFYIKYNWWNTLQLIDPTTNKSFWIIELQIDQRYKKHENKKAFININLSWTKIQVWLNIF